MHHGRETAARAGGVAAARDRERGRQGQHEGEHDGEQHDSVGAAERSGARHRLSTWERKETAAQVILNIPLVPVGITNRY